MSSGATAWPLIDIDATGAAYVKATRTKVIEIAIDRLAHHWDADEIQRQHPHLSLGQIHAVLAYYYEHQAECDRLIDDHRMQSEQIRVETENPILQARLRRLSGR